MKKVLYVFLSLNFLSLWSCRIFNKTLPTCYGTTYKDTLAVRYILGDELEVYHFQPKEVIASIGASDGWLEIAYTSLIDSLTFYIQDIDSLCLQPEHITDIHDWYKDLSDKSKTANIVPVLGSTDSLYLPLETFDKVLLRVTFHHIFLRNHILPNIKSILKGDGLLFIAENIEAETGKLDPDCKLPLWNPDDLINEVESYGFTLVRKVDLSPEVDYLNKRKKHTDFYIFVFKL